MYDEQTEDERITPVMSPVMSSEEEEIYRDFVGNLRDMGTLCEFEQLGKEKNPILAGKIVKISPTNKKNQDIRGPPITVVTLKEIYITSGRNRREFNVFFANEAAKIMEQSKLQRKDYLAVTKPKLFRDSSFSSSLKHSFNVVLIVGIQNGNQIEDIFGKRNSMKDWDRISIVSRRQNSKFHITFNENKMLASKKGVEENDEDEIPGSLDSFSHLLASTSTRGRSDFRFRGSRSTTKSNRLEKRKFNRICSDDEENDSGNMSVVEANTEPEDEEYLVSRTSLSIFVNDDVKPDLDSMRSKNDLHEEPSEVNILTTRFSSNDTRGIEESISPLDTENFRLKNIRKSMNVTIFGVITSTGKDPSMNINDEYFTKIVIADETKKQFLVNICAKANEIMPTLRLYDVIKLSNMKIVASKEELCGKIKHASDIVTFSREDPLVIFQQTQSYECSNEDCKRVEELIQWMQENLPEARIFTPICDIKNISASVNLSGNVMEKKFYEKPPNIVLRFCDGSRTREYFYCYDLTKNDLVANQEETLSKNLDFVDIVLVNADKDFCRKIGKLQIGTPVRLYDIRVKPLKYLGNENVNRHAIKLFSNAVYENIKFLCQDENQTETENTNIDEVDRFATIQSISNSPAVGPSRKSPRILNKKSKKRKLSVPKKSVALHDDEVSAVISKGVQTVQVHEEVVQHCEIESVALKTCSIRIPRLDTTMPGLQMNNLKGLLEPKNDVSVSSGLLTSSDQNKLYLLSMEISKSGINLHSTIAEHNDDCECLKEWPKRLDSNFWIQVSWVSMIPIISRESSELDVLALIRACCKHCKKCVPFFFATEWVQSANDVFSLCSLCKEKGEEVYLQHLLVADLLLQDCNGKRARAAVCGSIAEKLFGCTMSELINSEAKRAYVQNFVDACKNLTLKLQLLEETEHGTLFRVLDCLR